MRSHSKSKVYFFFWNTAFILRRRRLLKKFIKRIFIKEKKQLGSVNFVFCSDSDLLDLNNRFLAHKFYTDILTFSLSTNKKEIMGEVYISIDRVRENALKYNTSFYLELHRVLFHGALHLCGYRDKSQREINKMRKKENFYLAAFFKKNLP